MHVYGGSDFLFKRAVGQASPSQPHLRTDGLLSVYTPYSLLLRLKLQLGQVLTQSALELGPSHCPNKRLGQDLGFGGFAFSLKLPEWLNTNLVTVRAKLGPQI